MIKWHNKRGLRYPILTLLVLLLSVAASLLGLYLYHLSANERVVAIEQRVSFAPIKAKEQEILQKVLNQKPSEVADFLANQEKNSSCTSSEPAKESLHLPKPHKPKQKGSKAKLAIIIDDVAFGWQVRALQKLGLRLNLSFFPPSLRHPNTPRYAKRFRHYMIHLPMEATGFVNEEEKTLRVNSSKRYIEKVIADIRKKFPRAKFINNHTGSCFTANYKAMKRLIKVLDKYGFYFIDSRTTPKTQVPRLMRELGRAYLARDIFLDNELNVAYIKRQIKKAVRRAKRKGFAIAIGHPHRATIQALRESKKVLKEVELIYVDELR